MKLGGMCMNWKVVAGLAVVGLGVWAVAPNLIGAALPFLILAICPLSMVFMMRGMGGTGGRSRAVPARAEQPARTGEPSQIAETRDEQLAQLKVRHEEIAREIAQLEAERDPVARAERATERSMSLN